MSPLLLGAVWLMFVVSCFASMTPAGRRRAKPISTGGQDETT